MESPTSGLFDRPVKIKWQEKANCTSNGGAYHTAVLCNGKIYIGGGDEGRVGSRYGTESYRIDVYIPANNSWSPSSINTPCYYFAMTTLNNQLIIAGGKDRNDKVTNRILSLDGDHLMEFARMLTPRHWATAAGYQGTLIIVGGEDDWRRTLPTTELFDSITRKWYSTSDLPLPHCLLQSVIIDNVLFLLGGNNQGHASSVVFTAPLDTLSSHKLNWSTQQDTPWCRSAPVSIQGRHLLTVGGWKKTGVCTNDIYTFNNVSHSWEHIGTIPSAIQAPVALSISSNELIVVGGYDDKSQFTDTVWTGFCEPQ